MSTAQSAVFEGNNHRIQIRELAAHSSREVSDLLLRAVNCIDRDETIAIDLIRKASTLLRPNFSSHTASNTPATGGLAPWQVKRLQTFIAENLGQSISLNDMAQLVRLSTSYFSAAFKVSFGMSPHSYLVSKRVEHAQQRMLHSSAPLCEIALDCGLSDQAHLSRVFRKVTGTTPSAWRRYRMRPEFAMAALA